MSCSYSKSGRGASISGSISIMNGSEEHLQSAVANIGPIAVAVDARSAAFRVRFNTVSAWLFIHICTSNMQYYSGGVYSSTQCTSSTLTHAMLLTGYGTYNGKEYYLVKNRFFHKC